MEPETLGPSHFTLFDTPIGRCGIAWTALGISCLQLPEADDTHTRARLRRQVPGACESPPSAEAGRAIEAVRALLFGERIDLSFVTVDWAAVAPFDRRVYEVARTIPPGRTLTYGEVAARIGEPAAARAVGRALGQNPFAIIVPCHRVLAKGARTGGFTANGGVALKLRLLAIEGAQTSFSPDDAQASLFQP
jgi:methylated-DNA-[protein]-cysteine S-methyltransferase